MVKVRFLVLGGGKNEKLFVPLHPNVELSHGAAEDQSDMMMTTRDEENEKGTRH